MTVPSEASATPFDYAFPVAELFSSHFGRQHRVDYLRFARASEAIRFAMEHLDEKTLRATVLEVKEVRYSADEIKSLYSDEAYPLPRV